MKKFLAILAFVAILAVPVTDAASDECVTALPVVAYDGGYNGNGYCCPFPLVAQTQGVVADVVLAYECMTLNTTLAAGQLQIMAGAHMAIQCQNQNVSYDSGITKIDISQRQFQKVGHGCYEGGRMVLD